MATFLVLLRGVNVGKAQRIAMADFRSLLQAQGHTAVATLLNSGNAVFKSAQGSGVQLATRIAADLLRDQHLDVAVTVKSLREWETICTENLLAADARDATQLLVVVGQTPKALAALAAVATQLADGERWLMGAHAGYLDCSGGILQSAAAKTLLGKSGTQLTTRNWATVQKLLNLARQVDASA